ncbi:MAG: DsbA family oxidoreductase [Alphaproteobacteria bacterium]|nr:DsbA family oxidoreductase [Alphaproteobacteria bacterium]
MQIDIVSDTVCPWCYIGKRRLERALAQRPDMAFQLGWRPFQLNPDMPREGMDREQYLNLKFGDSDRARRIYNSVRQAGVEEGIPFSFDAIRRQPNTVDSHRLIRWAASEGLQDAVVEGLFRAYFTQGGDIGDREVLAQVAAQSGLDGAAIARRLAEDEDVELVQREETVARRLGINGVPCFIVDRKYAVSGAQDPSVLLQVFDLAARGANEEPQAAEESLST